MTAGAQQALRRTMEIYSSTTRFALACNQSNKIIEPIQSRCAILRFTKLSDEQVLKRLQEVIEEEKVKKRDLKRGGLSNNNVSVGFSRARGFGSHFICK